MYTPCTPCMLDVRTSSLLIYDHVHTQYAMDACCTHTLLPSTTMHTPSTSWMLAVATPTLPSTTMYTLQYAMCACCSAVFTPLYEPCTHPVRYECLHVRTSSLPLRPCTHPVRHGCLIVRTHLLAPLRPCTHPARHVWLMWHSFYSPSTTIYAPRSHGCLL